MFFWIEIANTGIPETSANPRINKPWYNEEYKQAKKKKPRDNAISLRNKFANYFIYFVQNLELQVCRRNSPRSILSFH